MSIARLLLAALLALPGLAPAQVISTFAGGGSVDGLPATSAYIGDPRGIALDASGTLYIVDATANALYRVDGAGILHVAMSGLSAPSGVSVDAGGNVFIANTGSSQVLRVEGGNGAISSLGSFGQVASVSTEGATLWVVSNNKPRVVQVNANTGIQLGGPTIPSGFFTIFAGVATDPLGNVYVADSANNRVLRWVHGGGTAVVFAGTGGQGFSGDGGPAAEATLQAPRGIAVDAAGNLFIADYGNNRVRRVDTTTRIITTVAGGGIGGDGSAPTAASLDGPQAVAIFGTALYVAERAHVRKADAGVITTVAGSTSGFGDGSAATLAQFGSPSAIAFDAAGNAFVADGGDARVRRIDAGTGVITTVAGNGLQASTGNGGQATAASLVPAGVAVDASGNVYISDSSSHTVRRVATGTGIISAYAGNGSAGQGGDGGPATSASLHSPTGLAFDSSGNLHIATESRVRMVDSAGIINIVAGGGSVFPASGERATDASFPGVSAIAFDQAGDLLITSYQSWRVRAATGKLEPITGDPGASRVAVDAGNNIYLGFPLNASIRRIGTDGRAIRLAGTGEAGEPAEGAYANTTRVSNQVALAIGLGGHAYIADAVARKVYRVTLASLMSDPPALDFAGRLPQTTSLPNPVTITNLGPSAATINSIVVPPPFAVSHDCGATVAARASCVANVTFTPTAVGGASATVDLDASLATQDVAVTGTGELSLVTHFYESIMRRRPDSGGKAFWDGERTRMQGLGASVNETWFAMSSFFFASAEYLTLGRDDPGFVVDLYRTFFNRAPDSGGQQFWLDQIAAGMPREVVMTAFQHSEEFRNFTTGLFGSVAARAEVDLVMDFYRGLLGRLPDNAGFNAWLTNMRQVQCLGATQVASMAQAISESFATSAEYFGRNRTNAQYVGDLYNAFLRRGGDLGGVSAWINSLNGTYTPGQLRAIFRASPEFQARVNAVVAQGCLP